MSVYRFKVYFEDDESVYREIEIQANQTFEDLHHAIQKAIEFDDKHPASFFISNDTWRKGIEIKLLRDKKNAPKGDLWMHVAKIAPYVEDPHQKIIYEYDPLNTCWTLYVELLKILPDSPISYPRVSKSKGRAPVQYKVVAPVTAAKEEDEEEQTAVEEEDNYVNSLTGRYADKEQEESMDEEMPAAVKASNGNEEEPLVDADDTTEEDDDDNNFDSEELS